MVGAADCPQWHSTPKINGTLRDTVGYSGKAENMKATYFVIMTSEPGKRPLAASCSCRLQEHVDAVGGTPRAKQRK